VTADVHVPPPSSSSGGRAALVRILPWVSLVIAAWAAVVWATGGFVVRFGSFRLSSRSPNNPLIFAAVGYAVTWLVATRDERSRFRHALGRVEDRLAFRLPPRATAAIAAAAAAFVLFIGVFFGIGTAGGADAYGYVSQGELWAHGSVRIHEPLLTKVDWPNETAILSPLGYRPAPDHQTIVPVYPPGLPLVFALFQRLGGRPAVFYAVPVLGALAVWATYLLGSFIGGREAGAMAAVLLATSPVLLFQDLIAMSDVPVAAWWAFSLFVFTSRRPVVALMAGLAAGIGILTRPNLAPLAVVPAVVLGWRALRSERERTALWARAGLWCTGTALGCLALAAINNHLYGSPLESGYGQIYDLYARSHVLTNVRLYTAWTLQSQTWLVLCALLAPLAIAWRATDDAVIAVKDVFVATTGLIVVTVVSYLPYSVFDRWFWVRFLLPAWPPLLILTSVGLMWLCRKLARRHAVLLATTVTLLVASRNVYFLQRDSAFGMKEGERKSPAIGRYIADHMAESAVFLTMQQSGSVRYYSGRLTLRFDWIPPDKLDRVVADLVRLDYHPYVLLEQWEEPNFREQFSRSSRAGALDWPPVASLDHSTPVLIYDLLEPDRQKSEDRFPTIVH